MRAAPGYGPEVTDAEAHAETYATYRNLLFTVAYEVLGSAADAEDVLQETWLRWAEVDLAEVRDPRAYLVRVVTRQSLNRLRTLARRKESYVGPWLPEPLLTVPDVAEDVELADSVSTAMLLVLETLTPTERAVFVLREVFDVPYDEIAAAVDKSPAAVRQVAHRARGHVAARRPRVSVSRAEQQAVVDRFLAAAATGDLASLVEALAPDVVLTSDGGGLRSAALRPITGRDKVLRFLLGVLPTEGDVRMDTVDLNGAPALRFVIDGVLDTVATLLVEDGAVSGIYVVRNPEKLARLGHPDGPVVLAR
ncbi:RNA polymerase sigma-70 factor [Nocardioides sp. zg-578]|nr:RNA polymerase sigma-70 factor [Nocardioides marmotae]MTB84014.1 RNA polymerase sigma-70 factor [Nocardioides marmotae]